MALTPLGFKVESGSFGSVNTVRLEITNYNQILTTLANLDKKYVSELRKDFKKIAKEPQNAVRQAIPPKTQPPMTNMRQVHFGRLAWSSSFGKGAKHSKSVIIQTPNTRSKAYSKLDRIPIVRLQILSPATVLYDMAYRRRGAKGRKGKTPLYDYMYTINGQKVPGKRQHRVVPGAFALGIAFSSGWKKIEASRMIWPAVEKAMPKAVREMDFVITKYNRIINRKLESDGR